VSVYLAAAKSWSRRLLPPSPPAEKATRPPRPGGNSRTGDGTGDGSISVKLRSKDVPRIGNDIQVTVSAKQPRNLKELFAIFLSREFVAHRTHGALAIRAFQTSKKGAKFQKGDLL